VEHNLWSDSTPNSTSAFLPEMKKSLLLKRLYVVGPLISPLVSPRQPPPPPLRRRPPPPNDRQDDEGRRVGGEGDAYSRDKLVRMSGRNGSWSVRGCRFSTFPTNLPTRNIDDLDTPKSVFE
jgi:hypothetical protein